MESNENKLLDCKDYDEYLDTFVGPEDYLYLGSILLARKITELGCRYKGDILTRQQFKVRRALALDHLIPNRHQILASENIQITDPVLKNLAAREQMNRSHTLSTIIFIKVITKTGLEISSYIDFEHSLRTADWKPEKSIDWRAVFTQKKRLWPRKTDLSYLHWRSGSPIHNHTNNYRVISDPNKGLYFLHRGDHNLICVNPLDSPGSYTTRTVVKSDKYTNIVLYDHIIRKHLEFSSNLYNVRISSG